MKRAKNDTYSMNHKNDSKYRILSNLLAPGEVCNVRRGHPRVSGGQCVGGDAVSFLIS